MFEKALRKFFHQATYIQLDRDWIRIRDVIGKREIKEVPILAISDGGSQRTILAVGAKSIEAAQQTGAILIKPFDHPRSLLSDFSSAEQILKYFVMQLYNGSMLKPSPVVVVHPVPELEGGYTQVEVRAFTELGMAIRATKVHVWTGRSLTDDEVAEEKFPTAGGELLESPLLSS